MVGVEFLLRNLEAHARRVLVTLGPVVHRQREALRLRERCRDGLAHVRRERGQAALAGQVVTEESDAVQGRQ